MGILLASVSLSCYTEYANKAPVQPGGGGIPAARGGCIGGFVPACGADRPARRGPDGPEPIPAPARTFAAKGGDAYDCPQMKKLLQIVSAHSHRLMAMLTRRSNCSLAEAYQ